MDGTVSTPTTSTGLAGVKQEIERACREAKRDPATVTLVAVSKTFAADAIEPNEPTAIRIDRTMAEHRGVHL